MNKIIHKTTLSLLGITVLSSLLLSSTHVFSDTEVIDEVRLTVPVACTMSGTGTTHTATLSPGTYSGASGNEYENGIGKTTLTAICNDDNGFSIYAIGFTGNEYGVTNLVGENTSGTIATKAYASGDTTSNWSMKLTKVDNPISGDPVTYNPQNLTITTSYDTWHAIPSDYTKVAEYHASTGSSTTDTTLGVKLETTYAAYIASNQAADTYEGQVKYTMVHPYDYESPGSHITEAGCISYYKNGADVEGTMGCQPIAASDTSTMLLASNFSRQGYGFAGWSDVFDYDTNPNAHFYGPQETITFTAGQYTDPNPGLSLYAVWVKSVGNLQDSSKVTELCGTSSNTGTLTIAPTNGTANLDSVSALTDQRDNETYAIARLADGNCWMIENLRLESSNSDNSTGALAQGYGTSSTYGSFSGLADAESTGFSNTYSANSLYSKDGSINTINIGTKNSPAYRMPRYNNTNTPTSIHDRPQNPTSNYFSNNTTSGMYSYGNYYTWHAAIADTAYYSSGDRDSTSLCPKGWRLPIGRQSTANNSFGKLSVSIGGPANGAIAHSSTNPTGAVMSDRFRSYPNNFLYSGSIGGVVNGLTNRGSVGYYWSSTVGDTVTSYLFSFDNEIVRPGSIANEKYYGNSVRCIVPLGA